jgi:hypothetical protein
MKKVMIALFLVAGSVGITQKANAQISLSINIGSQPAWGPTGYDHADFYYLPDANAYYDIGRRQFVYQNGPNWIYGSTLPGRWANINLYNTYKVVVNRPTPFRNNSADMRAYGRYKGMHNQAVIRDSRDSKYFASYNHPQHQQWTRTHGNGGNNGNNGNNHGNDHGNGGRGNGGNNDHGGHDDHGGR